MSQLASYKRYWEPNYFQVMGVSLSVGALVSFVTHPIEVVKTRVQVRAEGIGMVNNNHWMGYNPNKVFRQIHETGVGIRGFSVGFKAALASRLGYLLVRNSIYKIVYDRFKPVKPSNDLTTREKGVIAGVAGGLAALVTTPFELISTRQIIDGGLPERIRRNYGSFSDAYAKIVSQEGTRGLFKGGVINVARAIVMNASLTGCYDYLREKLWITFGDYGFIDTVAIIWAAFWTTLFTLPVDNIKTRWMRAFNDPLKNRLHFRSYIECFEGLLQAEGVTGLYVGAFPFYVKMYIMCYITTLIVDTQMEKWKKQAGLQEWQI